MIPVCNYVTENGISAWDASSERQWKVNEDICLMIYDSALSSTESGNDNGCVIGKADSILPHFIRFGLRFVNMNGELEQSLWVLMGGFFRTHFIYAAAFGLLAGQNFCRCFRLELRARPSREDVGKSVIKGRKSLRLRALVEVQGRLKAAEINSLNIAEGKWLSDISPMLICTHELAEETWRSPGPFMVGVIVQVATTVSRPSSSIYNHKFKAFLVVYMIPNILNTEIRHIIFGQCICMHDLHWNFMWTQAMSLQLSSVKMSFCINLKGIFFKLSRDGLVWRLLLCRARGRVILWENYYKFTPVSGEHMGVAKSSINEPLCNVTGAKSRQLGLTFTRAGVAYNRPRRAEFANHRSQSISARFAYQHSPSKIIGSTLFGAAYDANQKGVVYLTHTPRVGELHSMTIVTDGDDVPKKVRKNIVASHTASANRHHFPEILRDIRNIWAILTNDQLPASTYDQLKQRLISSSERVRKPNDDSKHFHPYFPDACEEDMNSWASSFEPGETDAGAFEVEDWFDSMVQTIGYLERRGHLKSERTSIASQKLCE